MLNLINKDPKVHLSFLDEIARQGARNILVHALNEEVSDYINGHRELRDEGGHRLVVRNGKGQPREITLGGGRMEVQAPRVNDRREGMKFSSNILPPYLRRSPNVESLLPVLYLKGLSTEDFADALVSILGDGAKGMSASTIVSLKKSWEKEQKEWGKRLILDDFVYIWADGVNVKIRLGEDRKLCLLVIIGATSDGEKKLLAVTPGYRESKESWKVVLESLKSRGFRAPLLAVADGALGFWGALREVDGFQSTLEARCWIHKIVNVMDCFPKRLQPQVKALLHEMMYAENKQAATTTKKQFDNLFFQKFPKAVEKLDSSWLELTAFFSFPASHWAHLRTTNIIESPFSAIKLRTRVTKGAGSPTAAAAMAFKLLQECEKRWRRLNEPMALKNLKLGVVYRDGIMLNETQNQKSVA